MFSRYRNLVDEQFMSNDDSGCFRNTVNWPSIGAIAESYLVKTYLISLIMFHHVKL